ncbi:hypothetical protein TNCV_1467481 [Trichonephila clavipes]|uniref:Uncharacterized protein n=1 Tax=Trichonephila clavipes TaxID=2585209 RepID=A0A8X6RX20_TRICX|nr:hypothetical protein TNCV_1467481 [Trichonephila clavipes]
MASDESNPLRGPSPIAHVLPYRARELLVGLKLTSLKQRWLYDYKWLESGIPGLESTPNKRYCLQEGRLSLPQSIDICTGSLLGIEREKTYVDNGSSACSDESKCTRYSDSRRVFTWRENGAHFHPSYAPKIDIFGGKGILACGGIMLRSRTPLYAFDASTVNSQHNRDDIL